MVVKRHAFRRFLDESIVPYDVNGAIGLALGAPIADVVIVAGTHCVIDNFPVTESRLDNQSSKRNDAPHAVAVGVRNNLFDCERRLEPHSDAHHCRELVAAQAERNSSLWVNDGPRNIKS